MPEPNKDGKLEVTPNDLSASSPEEGKTQPKPSNEAGSPQKTGDGERSQAIPRERFDQVQKENKRLALELRKTQEQVAQIQAQVEKKPSSDTSVPYTQRETLTQDEWSDWSEEDPYAANQWLHKQTVEQERRQTQFVEKRVQSQQKVFERYPQLNPKSEDFDPSNDYWKKFDEIACRPENKGVNEMPHGPEVVMRIMEDEMGLIGETVTKAKEEGVLEEHERQSRANALNTPGTEGKPTSTPSDEDPHKVLSKDQAMAANLLRADLKTAAKSKASKTIQDKSRDEGIRWR